ncbi:uncharacterized protein LOC134831976 [Culicoides brevitarsis]|uniref:uncharacterized protein LOC134831976 n=1 Tax=Culicoides brevitarsis TaxID=469753 RepID=UPI00307C4AAA
MDDMFLQCNKNTIYVLNSTYRYGEFDMIGLFGSAAGRAIVANNNNNNSSRKNSPAKKAYKSLSNMTAKSKSLDYELIHEQETSRRARNAAATNNVAPSSNSNSPYNGSDNLAKIHNGKKSKFWKIFESDKVNNKNSLEDISTASSKNSVSKSIKSTCKSSKELYREAAELLGLSCTLSDNCRCLDCQSGYFDCDDSDSMSDMDMSYMDEFEATNFMLMEDNATHENVQYYYETPHHSHHQQQTQETNVIDSHNDFDDVETLDDNDQLIKADNVECSTTSNNEDEHSATNEQQLIA